MKNSLSIDLLDRDIFAIHFRRWKRGSMRAFFPYSNFNFLPLFIDESDFFRSWSAKILSSARPTLMVWGLNISSRIASFAKDNAIPLVFVEDGFIRSLNPSASKSTPFSLTLDARAPYFDARTITDLEDLLMSYDFENDSNLIFRSTTAIERLIGSKLSKYNTSELASGDNGPSNSDGHILVLGQVEDDASIKVGCASMISNNDVVRLAAKENPGKKIVYRPHPDVLAGVRKGLSNPADVKDLCDIQQPRGSLHRALNKVDRVYTITSLAGFEALLRGIPVTVLGAPFYSGWGLTDDRYDTGRRRRKLSLEQLFAGAYLLYPLYFNPATGEQITFEGCIDLALKWKVAGEPPSRIIQEIAPRRPRYSIWGPYGPLGWRHLLTKPISSILRHFFSEKDAEDYRHNPILFFRELTNPTLRKIGKMLYPRD